MSDQPLPIHHRATDPGVARALLLLLAVSLCFVIGFTYLGTEVREPAMTSTDQHLLRRITEMTRPWPLVLSETASLFGTAPLVAVITAVVGASLARERRWFDIVLLIVAVIGAVLLSPLTKHLVSRARPTAFFRTSATGYSFPSGHTLNATTLALALGFILWRLPWHRAMKIAWTLALVIYVACVGASRIVLGVHYPTDVLGGFLLGVAWATLLMALVLGVERWRASRPKGRSGGGL
ncbi:MAG: phosphatase PAP2 family protein [Chloroflexota bacterium]|nr:phosphatase PAP2 family protein [Chloroflexota bacterium]